MRLSSFSWRRAALPVALLYLLLLWWWAEPLFTHFSTGFVGLPGGDANQYIWNAFNFRRQVLDGHNPWYTPLLLYPRGISLVMHTYTPIIGIMNLAIGQEAVATNLVLILSFVLSGLGAYRLCARWVANPIVCGLAGVVFAFSPYKLAHLPEHYHLLLTATVPFYVSAFLEAFEWQEGRWWPRIRHWGQVVLCMALGLLTLLSDYYTLFGLLYFSVGYAAYYGLQPNRIRWRRWQTWAVIGAWLLAGHWATGLLHKLHVSDNSGFWWGGDVAGYLLPPLNNRWLQMPFTAALHHSGMFHMPGSVENVMFLGYVLPLLLPLLLLVGSRGASVPGPAASPVLHPDWRPLPWLLLLFILLTMPELRVFGHNLVRLPTGLVHYVPFFNNIRCPTRHVSMVALLLPLVVLVPWQARLVQWRPATQWSVALILLGLVLLEYQPQRLPVRIVAQMPRAYQVVEQLPGTALVSVPFGLMDGYQQLGRMSSDELVYQTRHGKALPGAYISRVPAALFAGFAQEPVLRFLFSRQQNTDTLQAAHPTLPQLHTFLRTFRPSAFIVRPDFRNQPVHKSLRRLLQPLGYQEQVLDGYVLFTPPRAGLRR